MLKKIWHWAPDAYYVCLLRLPSLAGLCAIEDDKFLAEVAAGDGAAGADADGDGDAAMGDADDSDDDDARDATMFAKGDGRAPWEAASFFGWSNRLRGKNKKGRSRDRHACPDPRHCGPSQSRPTPRWRARLPR